MRVLVDYDNLGGGLMLRGVRETVTRLADVIGPSILSDESRIDFRFYGGWYDDVILTTAAQQLSADIQAELPIVHRVLERPKSVRKITIAAALAHSLEINPRQEMYSTFRKRHRLRKLECNSPASVGCVEQDCPLDVVYNFVRSGACPRHVCAISADHLLKPRGEQKLVDTMIVADLIHLAYLREAVVGVVSSDDDVWPGIISAMIMGAHIIHVETKWLGRTVPYLAGVQGFYTKLQLT